MSSVSQDSAATPAVRPATDTQLPLRHLIPLILVGVLVLATYVWFVSIGTWSHWPTTTAYYDQLASAFLRGQLSLQAQPDAALLALPNPYDPAARQHVPFLLDVSLYQGRFYLYFGPVPALLLGLTKLVVPGPIGDQYLVFAFVSGIFLVQCLLIVAIRRRFFPTAPAWSAAAFALSAGLTNPWPWILSRPSVYSAAVTGGQFFLLAGLLLILDTPVNTRMPHWRVGVAAVLWSLSIGCRISMVLPVAFLSVFLIATSGVGRRLPKTLAETLIPAVPLVGILAIGVGALAWYNWARFGSVFETGIAYQLSGAPLQQYDGRKLFPENVFQNVYNYLWTPPSVRPTFPYLRPSTASNTSVVPFVRLPPLYHAQEMLGLLFSVDIIPLALLPLGRLLIRKKHEQLRGTDRSVGWLIILLAGTFVSSFAFFSMYFWVTERFIVDFIPALILLSIAGAWQLDACLHRPLVRRLYWAALLVLLMASLLMGCLLAISLNADGFRRLNPLLWRQLSNLFRR